MPTCAKVRLPPAGAPLVHRPPGAEQGPRKIEEILSRVFHSDRIGLQPLSVELYPAARVLHQAWRRCSTLSNNLHCSSSAWSCTESRMCPEATSWQVYCCGCCLVTAATVIWHLGCFIADRSKVLLALLAPALIRPVTKQCTSCKQWSEEKHFWQNLCHLCGEAHLKAQWRNIRVSGEILWMLQRAIYTE